MGEGKERMEGVWKPEPARVSTKQCYSKFPDLYISVGEIPRSLMNWVDILCRRQRVEPSYPHSANVYELGPNPNFVPTISPPPYDADMPPDYTTIACDVALDDGKPPDDSLPAYDNCVSTTADEVSRRWI